MATAMAMSCAGGRKVVPLAASTSPATITENTQPSRLTGMFSVRWPWRSATVKVANPSAEARAARLPDSAPAASPSRTMTNMPMPASAMAAQVAGRTGSRKVTQPSRAARKGEAENRKTALATVVDWMAWIAPPKAATNASPPITPAQPVPLMRAIGCPLDRIATQRPRTGMAPAERQNSTCQVSATSIWRIARLISDHRAAATTTKRTPAR